MPSSFTVPSQMSGTVHHGCRRVSRHRCMFLHSSMRVTSAVWHLKDLESTSSVYQFVLNCFIVGQFLNYIKNSWFWECITFFLLVFSGIPTFRHLIGQFSGENNEVKHSGRLSNPRRTRPRSFMTSSFAFARNQKYKLYGGFTICFWRNIITFLKIPWPILNTEWIYRMNIEQPLGDRGILAELINIVPVIQSCLK